MSKQQPNPRTLDTTLQAFNTKSRLLNEAVVSPIAELGIAGFKFDIVEEHKIENTAEITDHFVEDNSTVNDHIAIKPIILTLRGFIGELVDSNTGSKSQFTEVAEKLTIINSYIPTLTAFTKQVQNEIKNNKLSTANEIKSAVGTSVDLFNIYNKLNPPKTKQAKAYNFFQALHQSKQLVSVDTPFGYFSKMAIQNIIAIQGDNAFISDFSVTLKSFRTVEVELVEFDQKKRQGRSANQIASQKDRGVLKGVKENVSLIFNLLN